MAIGLDHTTNFIEALPLPDSGPRMESADDPPVTFESGPQAVLIASQMTQFAASVAPEVRGAIADSLLIAQLAANKAADATGDVIGWYRKYVEVLQNLGWLARELEFRDQDITDADLGVHSAIIPVVTAMLGPGAAALAMVLSVLNGLQAMNPGSKWMKVFERASQQTRGAKFQLSQVDADAAGNPVVSLCCFGLLADHTLTQVLFCNFVRDKVSLRTGRSSLAITTQQLEQARAAISLRVRPFVNDFVADLQI